MALLERVGLADRRDTFPDKLSGGEQQHVAIARAWPTIRCSSWPTNRPAISMKTPVNASALLLDLTREAGKTLIMATHSPEVVPLADSVFRLHDGQLIATSGHSESDDFS